MDKQTYRDLLVLVNDKTVMDRIDQYAAARITLLRDQLETTKDNRRIPELQGAIYELRRWRTLRDEVIKGAE